MINGLLKGADPGHRLPQQRTSPRPEQAANAELATLTGKSLKPDILAETFKYITFTNDPIASSLLTDAQHAVAVGLLDPVSNLSTHLRPRSAQQAAVRSRGQHGEQLMSLAGNGRRGTPERAPGSPAFRT